MVLVEPAADVADPSEPPAPDLMQWAALALAGRSAPAAFAEAADALRVLRPFPWAVVLLDVGVAERPAGGHQLAHLAGGLIIETHGDHAAVTQQIQGVLERWTTRATARVETITRGGERSYRLVDTRLPAWAEIQWGTSGNRYIVALGTGAFERCRAVEHQTTPHAADALPQLLNTEDAKRARIAWGLRGKALRSALGSSIAGRPEAVFSALGLHADESALWTVRRDDRAVVVGMIRSRDGALRRESISEPVTDGSWRRRLPEAATTYAFIPHSPGDVIGRVTTAWLTSRRPEVQTRVTQAFEAFEQRAGVSVQADLLDQLGDGMLIHDFPRHPARLPLADTIVLEVTGDPARAAKALDALLAQCAEWLQPEGAAGSVWSLRLERLPEGIWTLRLGLYGPAVGLRERLLVVSYAPAAVREYFAWAAARGGEPTP